MPAVTSCYGQKGGVGSNGISELGAAGEVGTGPGTHGTLAWWPNFEWGWPCRWGLARLN